MSDDFYRAFEDEFRGSRALILKRLQVYRPLIDALRQQRSQDHDQDQTQPVALDLGCGRGEWLELLGEQGFRAEGVDRDDAMLAACRERGLRVRTGDVLEALHASPDASHTLVTGFHVAEHLPFEHLRQLVSEAQRVLCPGGVLILETPNPENLLVATNTFYLDPTHRQPLPPPLLDFLARQAGFTATHIVRLQAAAGLQEEGQSEEGQSEGGQNERKALTLMNVLEGVSPDYAVVAQKGGSATLEEALRPMLERGYDNRLGVLAARYQGQLEQRLAQAEQRYREVAQQLDTLTAQLATQLKEAQAEAEARTAELHLVYRSRSWRLTRPLRQAQLGWNKARAHGLRGTLNALRRRVASLFRRCGR